MGRKFCSGVLSIHAKSGNTNNHWNAVSDILDKSFFNHDSNDFKDFQKVVVLRKTGLKFMGLA